MKPARIFLAWFVFCSGPSMNAGTVTNNADSGSGSLRDILAAVTNGETVIFAPGLDGATITLTGGSLPISGREVTIDASALRSGITISGNSASRVLTITDNSSVTLRSLHLRNGREEAGNGGGVYAMQSALSFDACTIQGCFSAYNGGGLWANGVTGSITRCNLSGNQANSYGGGAFLIGISSLAISSTQISGNKSPYGGGIYNLVSAPALSNCSIQGNSGGGIRSESGSSPVLRNCIVWGNTADSGTTASKQLRNLSGSQPEVGYSLVEGASGSGSFNDGGLVVWSAGNIDGSNVANNPGFISATNPAHTPDPGADLRVYTGSPACDAGQTASAGTSLDLAGKARIQDGIIDLGAYEGGYVSFARSYSSLNADGDENGNGISNFTEYAMGHDPVVPGDQPPAQTLSMAGDHIHLTAIRRSNGIDVLPLWETSTDLSPSSWKPMVENVDYLLESTTVLSPSMEKIVLGLHAAGPVRFYRLGFPHEN